MAAWVSKERISFVGSIILRGMVRGVVVGGGGSSSDVGGGGGAAANLVASAAYTSFCGMLVGRCDSVCVALGAVVVWGCHGGEWLVLLMRLSAGGSNDDVLRRLSSVVSLTGVRSFWVLSALFSSFCS